MKIVILEDNQERREEMERLLKKRCHFASYRFFEISSECIAHLEVELPDTDLICLDHDLEMIDSGDGTCRDPGTGREVADFLALRPPVCPVVIHSTNSHAVMGMKAVLEEAGWVTHTVSPWGDLEWIRREWWPQVRKFVSDLSGRQ